VTVKERKWTDAVRKSFIISALRNASRRYPPKFNALKEALVGRKVNAKTGKLAYHYECAKCNGQFVSADVQADHILPVVDTKEGFVDWNTYIDRLFCDISNFQILCRSCHALKTADEKKQRSKKM
jgi:5-methylcytosine-specific restriction endonuclease McrA